MIQTVLQKLSRSLGGPSDNANPSTVTTSASTSQTTSDTEDQSVPDSYDQEDDVVSDNGAPASSNSSSRPQSRRSRKDNVTQEPIEAAPRRKSPHKQGGSLDKNHTSNEMPQSSSHRKRQNSATNPPPDVSNISNTQANQNANHVPSRRAPARSTTGVARKKKEQSMFKAPAAAPVPKGEITSLPIGPKRGRISGPEHDQRNEDLDRFHPSLANTPEAGSPPSLPLQHSIAQPSQPAEKRTLRSQEPVKQEGRLFDYCPEILDSEWDKTKEDLADIPFDTKMTIVDVFRGEEKEKSTLRSGKSKKRTSSERLGNDAAAAAAAAATSTSSSAGGSKAQGAEAATDESSEAQEPPRKKQNTKLIGPKLNLRKLDLSKYWTPQDAKKIKVDPLADGRYTKYHKKGEKTETRNKTYEQGVWQKKIANMEDLMSVLEGPSWYKEFKIKNLRGLAPEVLETLEEKREYAINKMKDFLEKNVRYKEKERLLKNHKGEWLGNIQEASPPGIDQAEHADTDAVTDDQIISKSQGQGTKQADEFEFQEEEHSNSSKRRPIAKATSKLAKLPNNSSDSIKSDTKSKAKAQSKTNVPAKPDGKVSNGKSKEATPLEPGVILSSKKGYVYIPEEKPDEAQEETPVVASRLRSGNNKRKAEELSKPDTQPASPPRSSITRKPAASKAPPKGKPATAAKKAPAKPAIVARKPPARRQHANQDEASSNQAGNSRRSSRLKGQEPSEDPDSTENSTKRQKID